MDELKPCPFCGLDTPDYCDEHGGDWHFIQCRSLECQAEGSRARSKDEAIAAWNRRAPASPSALSEAKEAVFLAAISDHRSIHCPNGARCGTETCKAIRALAATPQATAERKEIK